MYLFLIIALFYADYENYNKEQALSMNVHIIQKLEKVNFYQFNILGRLSVVYKC